MSLPDHQYWISNEMSLFLLKILNQTDLVLWWIVHSLSMTQKNHIITVEISDKQLLSTCKYWFLLLVDIRKDGWQAQTLC